MRQVSRPDIPIIIDTYQYPWLIGYHLVSLKIDRKFFRMKWELDMDEWNLWFILDVRYKNIVKLLFSIQSQSFSSHFQWFHLCCTFSRVRCARLMIRFCSWSIFLSEKWSESEGAIEYIKLMCFWIKWDAWHSAPISETTRAQYVTFPVRIWRAEVSEMSNKGES